MVVRSRILRAVATLTLLTCFVCPVLQMFDHWDHELQTGRDTEYTLVVVALCVGAVLAFTKLIVTFSPGLAGARFIPECCLYRGPNFDTLCFAGFNPPSESPPLSLRI